jgi:hypothetical protein
MRKRIASGATCASCRSPATTPSARQNNDLQKTLDMAFEIRVHWQNPNGQGVANRILSADDPAITLQSIARRRRRASPICASLPPPAKRSNSSSMTNRLSGNWW